MIFLGQSASDGRARRRGGARKGADAQALEDAGAIQRVVVLGCKFEGAQIAVSAEVPSEREEGQRRDEPVAAQADPAV